MRASSILIPAALLAVLAVSCGGGSGSGGNGGGGGGTGTPPTRTPVVNTIDPKLGPAGGGTAVRVTGSNFLAGDTLLIGGTAATAVNVTDSSTLTATTTARAAGTVDVAVRTSGGSTGTALSGGFSYFTLTANLGNSGMPYQVTDHRQPLTVNGRDSQAAPFTIVKYIWNCGQTTPRTPTDCVMDGTNPTPQWRYFRTNSAAGTATYTITLTVEDSQGNRATGTTTVSVRNGY